MQRSTMRPAAGVDDDAAAPRTTREPRVYHPPGTVRLVTPPEGAAPPRPRAAAPAAPDAADRRRVPTDRPSTRPRPDGSPPPEDIQMANFGVRTAYPVTAAPAALTRRPAAAPAAGLAGRVNRLLSGLFRAIDEAPFDLAWPPSARGLSRAGWPAPAASARPVAAGDDGDRFAERRVGDRRLRAAA